MNLIEQFGIANFKPFGDKLQNFNLKPITLVYGPNSIGKSSIIHSIAYFNNLYKNKSFSPSEVKEGDKINFGGFENFVHKKDLDNNITLEFTYNGAVKKTFDKYNSEVNGFDILRTGKYSHEERKNLLSLTPEDIIEAIRKEAYNQSIPDEYVDQSDKEIDFISWIIDNLTDFEQNTIKNTQLKEHVDILKESKFINSIIPSYKITSRIYNFPLGSLIQFYDNATESTRKLLEVSNLYSKQIKYEKLINNEWLEDKDLTNDNILKLNEDLLFNKVIDSEDKIKYTFANELYHYIQENISLNDIIKVNTTIGKSESGEICDLKTEYFIGNDWLISCIRNEEQLPNVNNGKGYYFLYNPKNEFIVDILSNIERVGNWTEEQNIQQFIDDNIISDKTIRDEDFIFSCNDYINQSKSILLDTDCIPEYIANALMNWDYDLETNYIEYLKRNSKHVQEDYKALRGEETNYDSIKNGFNISDEMYERISEKLNDENTEFGEAIDYKPSCLADALCLIIYSWLNDLNNSIMHTTGMKYIGPLRTFPDRHEFAYGDRAVDSDESTYAWEKLKHNTKLQDKLNEWLSGEKLKTPYELKLQKHIKLNKYNIAKLENIINQKDKFDEKDFNLMDTIEEFSFFDKRYDTPVNIREMGLGVSQVLPILVSLFDEKNKLIAVEQPELHLHPAVQSDLADEFIKSFKNNENTSLIETHSEHLLLRLMKRMRQTEEGTLPDNALALTPDDVSVLYVDADENQTFVQELRLSNKGKLLDHWPNGFFEEGFKERFS